MVNYTRRYFLVFTLLIAVLLQQGHVSLGLTGVVSPSNSIIGSHTNDNIVSGGVIVLPNGNIVISSPNWNGGMGAVTCLTPAQYKAGNIVVSAGNSLVGSTAGDQVGGDGILVLANGNYVIDTFSWNNNRGAVTWAKNDCTSAGTVSASNSLVGNTAGDQVGNNGSFGNSKSIVALSDGNYVIDSVDWNSNTGAVTWGNGTTGVNGTISASNSLVGSTANDRVGNYGITTLNSGSYIVDSPYWNSNRGAVTWGSGTSGVSGTISPSNSLIGNVGGAYCSSADCVGADGITALNNGNYIVASSYWNDSMGAATWGNGTVGISGTISAINSLVGSTANDRVGYYAVIALGNGNYVVDSPGWNGNMGAATWGNGITGISGAISASNSLVGSTANDRVGFDSVKALANGNYVIDSERWNGFRGAVTWGSGTTGISGVVSVSNSLVGSTSGTNCINADCVGGDNIIVMNNGNYLVDSNTWGGFRGAVTWGSGTTGISGVVSASNSLIGSLSGQDCNSADCVGSNLFILDNGNYVIDSFDWNGFRGAVTWGSGSSGVSGIVSASNSLVGSAANDRVGDSGVIALTNGNYIVNSPNWNGNVGAATWGSGNAGVTGTVSASNSLVGSTSGTYCNNADCIGAQGVYGLPNGNYLVFSPYWGGSVGAVTWGNGMTGISGIVSASNSLVGTTGGTSCINADCVGYYEAVLLTNGNYVVQSPSWNGNTGAATWGSESAGVTGKISANNSLVGNATGDGTGYVAALNNGNYVVSSSWSSNRGAATWGDGTKGTIGTVSANNSLVGSTGGSSCPPADCVSTGGIVALPDGGYLVISRYWNSGSVTAVGAVTYNDGLPVSAKINTIGIYRGGTFYLRLHNSTGNADITVAFTAGTKPYPVVGDWTGAGFDTVGVYDQNNGQFSLRNSNTPGLPDEHFVLGNPNDQPLSGRWLLNATTAGVGVFRPSNGLIYLKNALSTGYADDTMVLGIPGDTGLAGDWNGKGFDSPGVYRPSNSTFYLSNQVITGSVYGDYTVHYGVGGDAPVTGDWIAQGHDGIGLFRQSNGFTYLKNTLVTGYADNSFTYGIAGDVPVAGHWQAAYPPIARPESLLIAKTAIPVRPNGSGSIDNGGQIGD